MSIPEPTIKDISDTILAFVPIILITSLFGWSLRFMQQKRKSKKKEKEIINNVYTWGKATSTGELPLSYEQFKILTNSKGKKIRNKYYYCDYCGEKTNDKKHAQECLINKYSEVVINANIS